MTLRTESKRSRAQIVDALTAIYGYKCYMCERPFDEALHSVTIDHYHPLAKGGTWDLDNLRLCGLSCNQEKGDRLWLEDGTLEPRPVREPVFSVDKVSILSNHCELCEGGRLLMPDESCPDCFRGASPKPWTMKKRPSECSHAGHDWCWMDASGLIDRVPAFVYVLDGEYTDD
jgi:hypothetical protein